MRYGDGSIHYLVSVLELGLAGREREWYGIAIVIGEGDEKPHYTHLEVDVCPELGARQFQQSGLQC